MIVETPDESIDKTHAEILCLSISIPNISTLPTEKVPSGDRPDKKANTSLPWLLGI